MVKRTQTIRRQIADELFECVWLFYEVSTERVNMTLVLDHCFQIFFFLTLVLWICNDLRAPFSQLNLNMKGSNRSLEKGRKTACDFQCLSKLQFKTNLNKTDSLKTTLELWSLFFQYCKVLGSSRNKN